MGQTAGLFFLLLSAAWAAQQPNPRVEIKPRTTSYAASSETTPRIHLDVKLVLVPVSVTDRMDRPYHGLTKDNFLLKDEGNAQEITSFSSEDAPVSVGVVFDASSSMHDKIKESRDAVDRFLDTALPEDEFFLLRFNDRPEQLSSFTNDTGEIRSALRRVYATGWTALLDALYMGVQEMHKAANSRKALLVLSDGGDNNSRYSEMEIKDVVREADVRIFAVSVLDGSRLLKNLSNESGGRAFRVRKLKELDDVIAKISQSMRSEYVLGYSPGNLKSDGKYHKVKVELKLPPGSPRLHVSWKRGYYAPGE
jgi:Ca-activated chloride channel family protein